MTISRHLTPIIYLQLALFLCCCTRVNATTLLPLKSLTKSSNDQQDVMESNLADIVYEFELVFNEQPINETINLSMNDMTYIGWLRHQYIKLESQLWSEIDFHLNGNYVQNDEIDLIKMIRISHSIFLSGNFRENAINLNLFDSHDEILFDCIATINNSVQMAKKTYLKDLNAIETELKIMLVVQDHFELKRQLNDIYEFIASNEYYFKSVSVFRKGNKNVAIIL